MVHLRPVFFPLTQVVYVEHLYLDEWVKGHEKDTCQSALG